MTVCRFGLDCVQLSSVLPQQPNNLTQFKPKSHIIFLILLNTFSVACTCFTLTLNCPIQVSKFCYKITTVTYPLLAHIIKSMEIEKEIQSTKTSYELLRVQTIRLSIYNNTKNSERTHLTFPIRFQKNLQTNHHSDS